MPPDFDPDRYLAAYPDVALSGLDPAEHYVRFGRIMGRSPSPAPVRGPGAADEPKAAKASDTAAIRAPESTSRSSRPAALIERPADFDASDTCVKPAPLKTGGGANGGFALRDLRDGAPVETLAGLNAYQSMLGDGLAGTPSLGADELMNGPARIDNAWLSPGNVLRIFMADHSGEREGWTVRAYQADAGEPGTLHLAGPGILVPARGPLLIEFPLRNALMPLIIELAEAGGTVRALALLPFPSLLPGGLHGAELRALQPESNPVSAFWSLSDLLLKDLLGAPASPAYRIGCLSVSAPPIDEFGPWLAALFGFASSGAGKLARPGNGAELTLPTGFVPTISALVERSPDARSGAEPATCPFLVADRDTYRPRWSVVLPPDWDAGAQAPVIDFGEAPAMHVAIAYRAEPAPKVPDSTPTTKKGRSGRKLSVLLDAVDPQRAQASALALQTAIGGDLDLLVRMPGDRNALRDAIGGTWREMPDDQDLAVIAGEARHPLLLTISDAIDLRDGSALDVLAGMMRDEAVASASCLLLHQVSLKKQKVTQPASGGLFPAGLSFAASPSLSFAEPDVLQALPDMTYPVVANTLNFTLWRTAALAGLPRASIPLPRNAEDVRIGLALADLGKRNLCTTQCSVQLTGTYSPRDAIDPIGQVRLDPGNWERLLSRVTMLRQLF